MCTQAVRRERHLSGNRRPTQRLNRVANVFILPVIGCVRRASELSVKVLELKFKVRNESSALHNIPLLVSIFS